MRYTYTLRTTARDLWQLSMYYIYGSMAGVCNIVFTAAVFALGVSRWGQSGLLMKCMIVLGVLHVHSPAAFGDIQEGKKAGLRDHSGYTDLYGR